MSEGLTKNVLYQRTNVRFWPLADICNAKGHVRFIPKADMRGATKDVCYGPKANIRHLSTVDA
jgi:hypothetical protein